MSSLESASSLASFVVPIPRTSVVAEVWSEFASVFGVEQRHVDQIIKKGILNFLIKDITFHFLNAAGLIVLDVCLTLDWKKHELIVEHDANVRLRPEQPFTLQLHDGFGELFTFVHAVKKREAARSVTFSLQYRPEICADANLLARANAFLGVGPRPLPKYATGKLQPDLKFRLAVIPETTVIVRENWTEK